MAMAIMMRVVTGDGADSDSVMVIVMVMTNYILFVQLLRKSSLGKIVNSFRKKIVNSHLSKRAAAVIAAWKEMVNVEVCPINFCHGFKLFLHHYRCVHHRLRKKLNRRLQNPRQSPR